MGKKLKILVLTATLTCFASSFVSAETIATDTLIQSDTNDKVEQASYSTEDGFRYQVNSDETITITGYQGSETEISIPNEIDGKSVTSIGDGAFYGCSSLSKINIPASVTSIGWSAFDGCNNLREINVDEKNEKYSSENGILYNKEKTQLIRCTGGKTEVILPASVTSIGRSAFEDCSSLSKINIPEGVTSIGNEAFYGCRSLSEINIPEGVTSIGFGAFYDCSSLSEINIPASVTSIGDSAFWGCSSLSEINVDKKNEKYLSENSILYNKEKTQLIRCPEGKTEVTVPESVTSIAWGAFSGCSSLSEINVDEKNEKYSSENGILYNKEKTQLIRCPGGKTEVILPASVTSIGDGAFEDCSSLSKINIPEGVTSINWYAFDGCSNLKEVNIPEGVTSIGWYAFDGCSSLSKINIPASVTSIGWSAFSGCSSLSEINIPASVTSIGFGAFSGCSSLSEINVDKKNENYSSENGILYNKEKTQLIRCPGGKTEVTVPASVTSIESYAFDGCSSLSEINVDEKNEKYSSENGILYNKEKTQLIRCPGGKTEVILPASVTSINWYAFDGCSSLSKINIPASVTSIEYQTFSGCNNLSKINIPESVTSIEEMAFSGCSDLTIYGEENSYAQEYANKNNIPFKLSSEYDKDDTNTKPDGTATPPKDNQGDNKPTNPNPPKGDDGTNKDTSDVSSMAGIFTMFAGLIGTIGFKRKRK